MEMTVKDVLIAAKALISDPKNWIKGKFARISRNGAQVDSWDSKATCFCSLGAIDAVTSSWERRCDARDALDKSLDRNKYCVVPDFNDDVRTKHSDIMRMFDKAIEAQGIS